MTRRDIQQQSGPALQEIVVYQEKDKKENKLERRNLKVGFSNQLSLDPLPGLLHLSDWASILKSPFLFSISPFSTFLSFRVKNTCFVELGINSRMGLILD